MRLDRNLGQDPALETDADRVDVRPAPTQQLVVVPLPSAEPGPGGVECQAGQQNHVHVGRRQLFRLRYRLVESERVALARSAESMHGQPSGGRSPGQQPFDVRPVTGKATQIDLARHRQIRQHGAGGQQSEQLGHSPADRLGLVGRGGCRGPCGSAQIGLGDRRHRRERSEGPGTGFVAIVPGVRHLIAIPRTVLTGVVGFLATLVAAPSAWLLAHRDPESPHVDPVIRRWARAWLWAAGCRLEVRGAENIDRSRPHIVVANHLSVLDIMTCFVAIPLPIRYLAKRELFKIPILAPAMRAVGIVEVDRSGRTAAIQSVNRQSAPVIGRGHSLIIYPEGTRSREGTLRDFKKGAFTMAVTTGMPVLPVTIHGTWEAWQPHTPWVYGGKTITVIVDPAIETEGLGRNDVSTIRDTAHEIIAGNLLRLGAAMDRAGG